VDRTRSSKRLGDVLVQRGSLSPELLNRAIGLQQDQEKDKRLGEILLKDGLVSKVEIGHALEQIQGIPYVECPPPSIDDSVLELVPQTIAIRCCALPLEIKGRKLVVVMAEPQNLAYLDELRFRVGMPILPRFSFREDILNAIDKFYGTGLPVDDALEEEAEAVFGRDDEVRKDVEFIAEDLDDELDEAQRELHAGRKRTPAVRYLSNIMCSAVEKFASDIHIEPRAGATLVRIRVDGVLRELMTMPSEFQSAVVSRIKILSNMDISERRVPQDGRFLMQHKGRRLDLRISTLPTHFGEKVVIRVLDPRSTLITLDQLGFSDRLAGRLKKILTLPQGMLLVTGPTGSGKSTTLYGALNLLRSPRNNIVTVEDPVEYMLEGVNQVQVHPKAGLTFASCLPSILRQDPDVIMIGEIRNGETAEIAMNASQTGHLVLSTLHTNDSIGAITRLLDLGVPAYLIAASITGVLAQRLVRRLCTCRKEKPASAAYSQKLARIGVANPEQYKFEYEPLGCSICDATGFKGRVGIYEMLAIEDSVRDAIHTQASSDTILAIARTCGFRTLQEDALEKLKEGLTSLDELQRLVPWDAIKALRCKSCSKEIPANAGFCPQCGMVQANTSAADAGNVLANA
jgi:type IV pilus assembly protein PilB